MAVRRGPSKQKHPAEPSQPPGPQDMIIRQSSLGYIWGSWSHRDEEPKHGAWRVKKMSNKDPGEKINNNET